MYTVDDFRNCLHLKNNCHLLSTIPETTEPVMLEPLNFYFAIEAV